MRKKQWLYWIWLHIPFWLNPYPNNDPEVYKKQCEDVSNEQSKKRRERKKMVALIHMLWTQQDKLFKNFFKKRRERE